MLTQRLVTQQENMTGQLTITAHPGNLAELIGLADELALRSNVQTEGSIHFRGVQESDGTPNVPPAT